MGLIRGEDEILKSFEGLDFAPGSKKKRRELTPEVEKRRNQILSGSNGWDENPIIKVLKGTEVELFPMSALATALDKKPITVRVWEQKGYIPIAPYRLRSKTLNGEKVKGNRVYTRELIEITVEEFENRGLLGSARIEWSQHEDLTDVLVRRWKEAMSRES
jgi:hypothetical protein